jgi:hypothetical protein
MFSMTSPLPHCFQHLALTRLTTIGMDILNTLPASPWNFGEMGKMANSKSRFVDLSKKILYLSTHNTVKVLYWRPEAATPTEITFDISGCTKEDGNDGCKLGQFIERSKPYQMLPTPKEAADFYNLQKLP